MKKLSLKDVQKYVEENIGDFHKRRLDSLDKLKLDKVLKQKNPYLFKAKDLQTSEKLVEALVSAFLSSQEETILGNWLEGLAIYINKAIYGGWKSGISGIDLEFDKEGIRHIVNIKSGPKWGNSSQLKKMADEFNAAKRSLKTSNSKLHIEAINGCCYGKDGKPLKKGGYYKLCGQRFWEYISGDENLYVDIIEPIGFKARQKNEEFHKAYAKMINRFTTEFSNKFCLADGSINWEKIVRLNSSKEKSNLP